MNEEDKAVKLDATFFYQAVVFDSMTGYEPISNRFDSLEKLIEATLRGAFHQDGEMITITISKYKSLDPAIEAEHVADLFEVRRVTQYLTLMMCLTSGRNE